MGLPSIIILVFVYQVVFSLVLCSLYCSLHLHCSWYVCVSLTSYYSFSLSLYIKLIFVLNSCAVGRTWIFGKIEI